MYEGHKTEISIKSNDKNIILSYKISSLEYYTGILYK